MPQFTQSGFEVEVIRFGFNVSFVSCRTREYSAVLEMALPNILVQSNSLTCGSCYVQYLGSLSVLQLLGPGLESGEDTCSSRSCGSLAMMNK